MPQCPRCGTYHARLISSDSLSGSNYIPGISPGDSRVGRAQWMERVGLEEGQLILLPTYYLSMHHH